MLHGLLKNTVFYEINLPLFRHKLSSVLIGLLLCKVAPGTDTQGNENMVRIRHVSEDKRARVTSVSPLGHNPDSVE